MPPHACAEHWGKESQDLLLPKQPPTYYHGAIIVGAGPSGLATAACLHQQGVPSLIIEKSGCIASLWQQKAYDRLHLHLPKQFCELPFFPFPSHFPTYPTCQQFVEYLESYSCHFGLKPLFNHSVNVAAFDPRSGLWQLHTSCSGEGQAHRVREFQARWLVVASGENAEPIIPTFKGMNDFQSGRVFHSSQYRNGAEFEGKKVLVVGCGNSGMEIALDLANFGAVPYLVVRNPAHILPREIFGTSTYAVAMTLMKTFPCWFTDMLLVSCTYLVLGDTTKFGIRRPNEGPMLLKAKYGKTPILDVGTVAKIKSGDIKVLPAIEFMTKDGAQFEDGQREYFEAVILATGYRSNVPKWLKDDAKFFSEEGLPMTPFPHGWRAGSGLYVAGLRRKGLLGAAIDAKNIAIEIAAIYSETPSLKVNDHARQKS